MVVEEESFKKPGAVPFKWEIKPGVPKVQLQQQQPTKQNHHRSSQTGPPQKLRPPPSGSIFVPPPEPRSGSFRSSSRTRSERWRFDESFLFRSEVVSTGCFPSRLLRKNGSKSKKESRRTGRGSEPDYASELETLSRWSLSSRKSLVSSFRDLTTSPSSSSRSSYLSSPRPVSDAEWASFGLF